VTNNCEHFASWARNGWALSAQVLAVSDTLLKVRNNKEGGLK
jgi:hypothetical protein